MRKIHRFFFGLVIMLGLTWLSGCGRNPDYGQAVKGEFTVVADQLSTTAAATCILNFVRGVSGDETVKPTKRNGAFLFTARTEEGRVRIILVRAGTAESINKLRKGKADAAILLERYLTEKQKEGLEIIPLALLPMTVSVPLSTGAGISSVKFDDLRSIVVRNIKNMKEIGGSPAAIRVYIAGDMRSAFHLWIRDLITSPAPVSRYHDFNKKLPHDLAQKDKGAIVLAPGKSKLPGFKPISIDGHSPASKNYPLSCKLLTITGPASSSSSLLKSFLRYLTTPSAFEVLRSQGLPPLFKPRPVEN